MRQHQWEVVGIVVLAAALAGCARPYQPPKEGEDAALVKLKMEYGDAKARSLLPPARISEGVRVTLHIHEGQKQHLVYSQNHGSAFATAEAAVLEVQNARIHPGKAVTLGLRLAVVWQTQETRTVQRECRRPVTVRRTRSVYSFATKRYRTETVLVTEEVSDTCTEFDLVTLDHEAGCTATATLNPSTDEVYLLDYANPEIDSGCSLQAFRQRVADDGSFRLDPVGTELLR
jgi:hypothetical protein